MALKAIMLKRTIDKKTEELNQLRAKNEEFEKREKELEAAIAEADTDEAEQALNEEIEKFESDKRVHEAQVNEVESDLNRAKAELEQLEREAPIPEPPQKKRTERSLPMNFEKLKIDVRALPKNMKIFDAIDSNERTAIMQREDVKDFMERFKGAMRNKRDITGGELTIPVIFLDLIAQNLYRYSKLLNRVRVRNVSGQARQTIAGTVPPAIWTEMCGAINELTFQFNQITLDGYKVAGFIPVCNSLLEDSDIDIAGWILEMITESIGMSMDMAILYGNGSASKMPLGIVTRLAQSGKPSDYPATAPTWENLSSTNLIQIESDLTGAEFWAQLTIAASQTFNKYARGTMFWAMNSKTYALLKSKAITFTATGDVVANVYGVLPIINGDVDILEFMPDGDIVGGYGDLYLLAQRGGITIEQSREVQFIQDNTVFKGKMRADGAPIIASAFVAININGTSPTTSIVFPPDTANDATLNALTIGSYSLSPEFAATTQAYTVTATNASDAVTATPTQAGAQVAISYGGKNIKNGGNVTWTTGTNPLTITVTNGNDIIVYTVSVTKSGG